MRIWTPRVKLEESKFPYLKCITDLNHLLGSGKLFFAVKGARTYCIINKQDQPATKECNRNRQKLKKLFCASENGTLTASHRSTTRVPKVAEGFQNYPYGTVENITKELPSC